MNQQQETTFQKRSILYVTRPGNRKRMNRKRINEGRNQEKLFFLWYFGFRKNKVFKGNSHRRALLLPLHAVFAQQHQSSWVVSYKFPQCVLKITCCRARFLNQRLGQKYHFCRHRVSLCGDLPGHRHHILLYKCQSQSPFYMLKTLTTNLNMERFSRNAKLHLTRGKKTSVFNDKKSCKCVKFSLFPEKRLCGLSLVFLLWESLSKINLFL